MIDIISDHAARMKQLLPAQFVGLENWEKFIDALAVSIQAVENDIHDMFTSMSLSGATGVQLDKLGEILGETRKGRTDEEYRAFLSIRVKINISRGEPETLISVLSAITDSSYVILTEVYPARIEMFFSGMTIPDNLVSNMNLIKPAGVEIALYSNGGETPFVMDLDTGGLGLSDVGFENGGALVEVYS